MASMYITWPLRIEMRKCIIMQLQCCILGSSNFALKAPGLRIDGELFELFAFWSVRDRKGVREGSVRGSQEIWMEIGLDTRQLKEGWMVEAEGGGRVGWLLEVEGCRFGHRDHGGFMDRPKRKELFELFAFWSVRESQGVREGSVRGSQDKLEARVGGT